MQPLEPTDSARELSRRQVGRRMTRHLATGGWSVREQLAIACRYLAREGHCQTLAGQVTVRLDGGRFAAIPSAPPSTS